MIEYPGPHMVAKHRGGRDDRYKLMHFYVADEWEFFDLQMTHKKLTTRNKILSTNPRLNV